MILHGSLQIQIFFSSSASPWSPVDEDIHTFTHNPDFA